MTSTVHLQELKMQSHKQETTTLHTKTTQEMEGIQKVRAQGMRWLWPDCIYDNLVQSDSLLVNCQLGM